MREESASVGSGGAKKLCRLVRRREKHAWHLMCMLHNEQGLGAVDQVMPSLDPASQVGQTTQQETRHVVHIYICGGMHDTRVSWHP